MLLQNNLSDDLWNVVQTHYQNGDYTGSLRDAFIYLTTIIREKADLSGDGTDLINKAFSESNPKIKINRLESTSEIDEQKGIANILRGCYQYIRNPRSHDKYEDNENDCLAVLFFLDYIISKVKGSTGQFELSVFIKQIIDKRFVKTKEYCLVLINEIPQRKLFDTVLEIYKNKNQIDIYNCELIFQCFYEKLTASNITSLLNIYSEELRTTESDNDIKYIIKLIDPCMWERISPIARIRTENRIVEAIKDRNALATWCTAIFQYFKDKVALFCAAYSLVEENSDESLEYLYKYYFSELVQLIPLDKVGNSDDKYPPFDYDGMLLFFIREEIKNGNSIHYNAIKKKMYLLPEYIKSYFLPVLENYKEKESVLPDYPDDIPF